MLLSDDFRDLLSSLNDHNVTYMIVGGYAYNLYVEPRATNDIDIWVASDLDNSLKIFEVLKDFGALPAQKEKAFTNPDYILRFGIPPWKVEIMTNISGIKFDDAWKNHILKEIAPDLFVPTISFEDLIINKRASGRLKDLADLEELEKVRTLKETENK